jgi:hypothetical protein
MGIGTLMGFGGTKVKTKIRNRYEPYKRVGQMAANRIFKKNLSFDDRVKVNNALKEHLKGGRSITNKKILEVVKEKYNNYALKERIKKVLTADPKSGLTPEQIKRNINITRFFRNQGNVDEVQKAIYGIKRGSNISFMAKEKGGRITGAGEADNVIEHKFTPLKINANKENVFTSASSGQMEESVGKFGLADMSKEKSTVSIGSAISEKSDKNKQKDLSNFNKFKARNINNSGSIPFSK